MADLSVNIGELQMKNPVMTASGTFGYGEEFADFIDISRIGGIIVKGTTLHKREGNPYPRMAETPSGMLNAVGLQNKGVHYFVEHIYPRIKDIKTNMIVNVSGSAIEDYMETAAIINELVNIPAIELNISCPNVKEGGIAFGQVPASAERITKAVKKVARQPVIMKLSPNVTDITEMAKAVEAGGADAVSLINTLTGMKIDINRRTFAVANKTGGLSGPAIKPVAVRMVYQVANAVALPIIGMGGIANADDALEFIMAGATMVSVGTANFNDPLTTIKVVDGIRDYCAKNGVADINELIGCVK
mgnify:CR=1 FL=1